MKVVCYLGKNAGPIDRVDCSKIEGFINFRVSEECLDGVLELVRFCKYIGENYDLPGNHQKYPQQPNCAHWHLTQ